MARDQRIVLHLRFGSAERVTIRVAAELAHMLGLALHGVFLQDETLTELTALPFVREFRLATGAWQALDAGRMAEEQRAAVDEARRLLDEAAAAFGVSMLFNMGGDGPGAASREGDIIVVAQPRLQAEQLVHATAGWLEAAHRRGASVMLVPPLLARRDGPIAVVVCPDSDAALTMAARLAVSANEGLLVLAWGPPEMAQQAVEESRAAGVPAARIMVRQLSGVSPEQVTEALDASGERLVVLASGACGADNAAVSSLLAASRGVPVLVVVVER